MINTQVIADYIEKHLECSAIHVRDDAHLHQSHTQFQAKKAYLCISISLSTQMSRIALHRKVMSLAKECCPIPIHAVQVIINKI